MWRLLDLNICQTEVHYVSPSTLFSQNRTEHQTFGPTQQSVAILSGSTIGLAVVRKSEPTVTRLSHGIISFIT